MSVAAEIECRGVPIDVELLSRLKRHWVTITARLIERVNAYYGVYEDGSFRAARFEAWLASNGIPWPRLASDHLDLKDDTFREMARVHPQVAALKELRATLSQLRLADLAVGADGRNRVLLSPFSSRTSRNQPSNSRFIFGPAAWMRGLIRPEPGSGLAYVDYSQQEFGIAAALSRDTNMLTAYTSGDPYLKFAQQAGAVPPHATKTSHKAEREQFKACVLAVQYGMAAESLAIRIGQPVARARELLGLHRQTYPTFWRWSDAAVDHAMILNHLHTVFGWQINVATDPNPRFLRNFPMQANGAEMLRLACILASRRGIRICAPVHDALLIEAPLEGLDNAVTLTQTAMAEASSIVLSGFELRSDAALVRYPDRYADERGAAMWATVMQLLDEIEAAP